MEVRWSHAGGLSRWGRPQVLMSRTRSSGLVPGWFELERAGIRSYVSAEVWATRAGRREDEAVVAGDEAEGSTVVSRLHDRLDMPPRDKPAKKLGGAEKKAEAAEEKSRAAQQVANKKEDDEWSKGAKGQSRLSGLRSSCVLTMGYVLGKGNKEDKAAKEEDARARKAESARLLALEEAAAPKVKAAPVKKAAAKAPVKVVPAKIPSFEDGIEDDEPTQFGASGIVSSSSTVERRTR